MLPVYLLFYLMLPYEECIGRCVNLNWDIFEHNGCKFDKPNFRKLHMLAVKDNHFVFDGKLYDQINGVAMGSPLGPSMANFLCVLWRRGSLVIVLRSANLLFTVVL